MTEAEQELALLRRLIAARLAWTTEKRDAAIAARDDRDKSDDDMGYMYALGSSGRLNETIHVLTELLNPQEALRQTKARLLTSARACGPVSAVGGDAQTLIVYAGPGVEASAFPKSYEGIPVVIKSVGDITAGG